MNSYEYTEVNRLEKPHKYMYTSYLGAHFLSSYFNDRLKHIKRFQKKFKIRDNQSIYLYLYLEAKNILNIQPLKEVIELDNLGATVETSASNKDLKIENLSSFNIKTNIDTELLLTSIVYTQVKLKKDELVKKWLDHLVQRFEVTKKIYIKYLEGFRKGEGATDNLRLYWLLSLSLALCYNNTKNIKYLNTLLKISDLLCSLETNVLANEIPLECLSMIIQLEIFYVRSISDKVERVSFDFN